MFDEEPDDPHGECRAEIDKLAGHVSTLRSALCLVGTLRRCGGMTLAVRSMIDKIIDVADDALKETKQ